MSDQQEEKKTEEDFIQKMVPLHNEIDSINDDIKEIVKEAKDAGFNGSTLSKIAKAKAKAKLGDMKAEMTDTLALIERISS